MSKAVTKKEETSVAVVNVTETLEGAGLNTQDMILPALVVRQNSYKKDTMKTLIPGQVALFPQGEVVADEKKKMAFIPVSMEKLYRICDVTEKQPRTVGWEPWTTDLEWTFERDGKQYRRDKSYVAHVLSREGLDAQSKMLQRAQAGEFVDPSDFSLPIRVIFTRGSLNAGKVLSTHFEMSKAIKQTPAAIMFELWTKEQKNDAGTFFVYECAKVTNSDLKYTPKEVLPIAQFWATTMQNAATRFRSLDTVEEEGVAKTVTVDEERF